MKYLEKHPIIMILIGVIGISMSSIFVKLSDGPSAVTAAWRLLWTVLLMTPVSLGSRQFRQELTHVARKEFWLSTLSGVFLAVHFVLWFESLKHTSVASSTTIVCTEVIWVSLGYWLLLKGKLEKRALLAIGVTFAGSVLIALADSSASEAHLYGDILALLAAIAVAAYVLLGGILRQRLSTTTYTYIVYSACVVALVLCCLAQGNDLIEFGLGPVLVGFLLAVFSTILGHSIFSWCLRFFSPSFVSASKLCEPVAAAVMAGFLFGEIPNGTQLLGAGLILGGVAYYSKIEQR